jgi:hypothetical protein
VLLELTVLRFAWTFNLDYAHYSLAGVIWMLGWCMVLLAGIIYMPMWAIAPLGVVIIVAHPVLYPILGAIHAPEGSVLDAIFKVLYLGDGFSIGKDGPPLLGPFVFLPHRGGRRPRSAVMRWSPAPPHLLPASGDRRDGVLRRVARARWIFGDRGTGMT